MNETADSPDLCVVAHRLPVHHDTDLGWQRSPGGLVSALRPALDGSSGAWFGHLPDDAPDPPTGLTDVRLVPIRIDDTTRERAIDGCCNRTLWPALHGRTGNVEQRAEWWSDYFRHADRSARLVAERAAPGATVWVHDYHFFGIARNLRRLRGDVHLGLFCHTPIQPITFGLLRERGVLLDRMASFDLIATQTGSDATNLQAAFESIDLECPVIRSIPVGLNLDAWDTYAQDPTVEALASRQRRVAGSLAVGVDRADYTKGVVSKLLAIEICLSRGDFAADDFRLVQVATPTRRGIPAYDLVFQEIRRATQRINADHPRSDGRNVIELHTTPMAPKEVAGLMRAADLALITPVCDGMNLVALEFSVVNEDRGVDVVLGRSAGAASYIGEHCDLVDGNDVLDIARSLADCVTRPRLDLQRSQRRGHDARRLTTRRWIGDFTRALEEAGPAATALPNSDIADDDPRNDTVTVTEFADLASVRARAENFLLRNGSSDEAIADTKVVVTEIVSNALQHADAASIAVTLSLTDTGIRLSISHQDDDDTPLVVDRAAPAPDAAAGRGLSIVAALTRQMTSQVRANRRTTTLVMAAGAERTRTGESRVPS